MAWYNNDWAHRKEITINQSSHISTTLTDFSVPIIITDTDLRDDARSDGFDILFTSDDEVTKLPHDIQTFDDSTGDLIAWVKVPTLLPSADATVYLYYGNPSATLQADPYNAYDANTVAHWHLDEDPTGPGFPNSAQPAHGGTAGNLVAGDSVDGIIHKAISLDGSNKYVEIANHADFQVDQTDPVTISFWAYSRFSLNMALISKALNLNSQGWIIYQTGTRDVHVQFANSGSNAVERRMNQFPAQNIWFHVAITKDTTDDAAGITLYYNGAEVTGVTVQDTLTASSVSTDDLRFGLDTGDTNDLFGRIDEVRIDTVERSADWVKLIFESMDDPANFVTVGTEENAPSGTARQLTATITASSSTPSIDRILDRQLLATVAAAGTTPAVNTAVERSIAVAMTVASSTPDANAILGREFLSTPAASSSTADIDSILQREIIANLSASSTSPTVDSLYERHLSGAINTTSSTSNADANLDIRFLFSIAAASTTPDIDLIHDRQITSQIDITSSTPDIDTRTGRELTASLHASSSTPAVQISIAGTINLMGTINAASSTPDANAAVEHPLSATIAVESVTPIASGIVDRRLNAAIAANSATPNVAAITSREFSFSAQAVSSTPDVTISLADEISLTSTIAAVSTTPSANVATEREFLNTVTASSFTPAITISISGEIQLTTVIGATSSTPTIDNSLLRTLSGFIHLTTSIPDIDHRFDRMLMASLGAVSSTPMPGIQTDRFFDAAMTMQSSTPDNVPIVIILPTAILDPGVVSLTQTRQSVSITRLKSIVSL